MARYSNESLHRQAAAKFDLEFFSRPCEGRGRIGKPKLNIAVRICEFFVLHTTRKAKNQATCQ